MASTGQADGTRSIIRWLLLEVLLLLGILLTLVTWTHDDYHYSVYVVFGVGLVIAALVLPFWAISGLGEGDEDEA